jgi:Tfp pilus assembly protein PilP
LLPIAAAAQDKPANAPAPKGPAPALAASGSDSYTYDQAGRRDPFVSLIRTGAEPRLARRGEGAAGMPVNDITVRGVVQSRNAYIAMVQGADKKTYVVHQGDRFLDGTITSITAQGLVIQQEVSDPLSLIKQREIRKPLRSLQEPKE